MKALKISLVVIAVILVVVILSLFVFLGSIVRTAVLTAGPKLTGVEMKLDKVRLSPLTGKGQIKGLVVGNPEGFKTPEAIKLGEFKVAVEVGSVLSDRIIIEDILIDGPVFTYELGLGKSNIGALLDNIEAASGGPAEPGEEPEEEPEEEAPAEPEAAGKKLQINHFLIQNAKVRLSAKLMGGKALTIPLPKIELHDIGKEKEGASIAETVATVFRAVVGAIVKAVGGAGAAIGKGAMAVGELGLDGAKAVGGVAVDGAAAVGGAAADGAAVVGGAAVDGAKVVGGAAVDGAAAVGGMAADGAKAVGGVAADGAKAVGGAAAGGAKAVGGAATKGVKSVFGGVKGLMGGGKDKTEETAPETEQP